MTHYAALWMFGNYYTNYKPNSTQLTFVVTSGVILLVGFAYLVMVVYDIPLRKYLSDKRKEKLAKLKNENI
jgi:peptidoglycan/LPS O-acetylase OafA/YrhL